MQAAEDAEDLRIVQHKRNVHQRAWFAYARHGFVRPGGTAWPDDEDLYHEDQHCYELEVAVEPAPRQNFRPSHAISRRSDATTSSSAAAAAGASASHAVVLAPAKYFLSAPRSSTSEFAICSATS